MAEYTEVSTHLHKQANGEIYTAKGRVEDCASNFCREAAKTEMREFSTGATRNIDTNKPDYEGFFSPLVLERRAQFMHKNRLQADGKLRDSDNWQKGIPFQAYMKSAFRHFMSWWRSHRTNAPAVVVLDTIEEDICALMFNCEGYLHELLKIRQCVKDTQNHGVK